MYRLGILLFGLFIGSTAMAQDAAMISQEETDAQFRALVAQTPLLDYELESFQLNSPVSLVQVSALAQDSSGNLYILHRNLEIDPVIVADPAGNILRSFGQGLNVWPHGIRIDDEGNVWTVDSTSSVVLKFTAEGELLLRTKWASCLIRADVPVRLQMWPLGSMAMSMSVTATVIQELLNMMLPATRFANGVGQAMVPVSSISCMPLLSMPPATSTWQTVKTVVSSGSMPSAIIWVTGISAAEF